MSDTPPDPTRRNDLERDFAGPVDPVLRALSDMWVRAGQGLPVRAENYLDLADSFWLDPDRVLDLVYAEYVVLSELGIPRTAGELRARFPHLTARIDRQIGVHEALVGASLSQTISVAGDPAQIGTTLEPEGEPISIGNYRVITWLGSGGQASVCRAFQSDLARDVIIKLAHRHVSLGDEDRIRTEGRVLAGIIHPSVARVLDFGMYAGRPFLVIENVVGRSLERVAAEVRLRPAAAGRLVARVALATATAHSHGVLHCDLKPANILIDQDGNPVVIDFGLARLYADGGAGGPPGVTGTPAFMAPEQAVGDPVRLTTRTDVFGLGAVLYFLLTGYPPYSPGPLPELLDRVRSGDWDRARLSRSGAPSRLCAVCEKAMSRDPELRYKTATDFARDLTPLVTWKFIMVAMSFLIVAVTIGVWQSSRGSGYNQRDGSNHHRITPPFSSPSYSSMPPPSIPDFIPPLPQPNIRIRVFDPHPAQNRYRDLIHRLPLATGDELRVEGDRPAGQYVILIAVAPNGPVRVLTTTGPDGPGTTILYPEAQDQASRLEPPTGTVVILLCGRRSSPVTVDEIRTAVGPEPWPVLPPQSLIHLEKSKVTSISGRGVGEPIPRTDPEGDVIRRLESVRVSLGLCDSLAGVAFSHR